MPKKKIWDNPLQDYIFEERWKERALEEVTEIQKITKNDEDKPLGEESEAEKNKQLEIYLEIIEAIGDDEELKKLLLELEESIIAYYNSINNLRKKRRDKPDDRQEMEDSDWNRKRKHNAVVDNLSILSRAYVKKKGINHWRIKIDEGRRDRERIANWVKAVAPFIKQKLQNPEQ